MTAMHSGKSGGCLHDAGPLVELLNIKERAAEVACTCSGAKPLLFCDESNDVHSQNF